MSSYYNPPEQKVRAEILPDGIRRRVSSCCGAVPRSYGDNDCDDEDFGICPKCKEHCDYVYPEPDPDDPRDERDDR